VNVIIKFGVIYNAGDFLTGICHVLELSFTGDLTGICHVLELPFTGDLTGIYHVLDLPFTGDSERYSYINLLAPKFYI
jgi:hypothetical protein